MSDSVTREEFKALDREVEGEKMVTRHILEQTRRNSDDLAAVLTRLDRVERKVDDNDRRLTGRIDGLERKVDDLTKNLPRIVGDVMREVLDERDRRL
jgi:tetrahydromethanopterin S-methyltransferase subunit G